jgi:hypothetical protein
MMKNEFVEKMVKVLSKKLSELEREERIRTREKRRKMLLK